MQVVARAHRINTKKSDAMMGLCDFTCPTDCERREGNTCHHYRGSTDEGRKTPFSRRVYPSKYCPHNREKELARIMYREGVMEWR